MNAPSRLAAAALAALLAWAACPLPAAAQNLRGVPLEALLPTAKRGEAAAQREMGRRCQNGLGVPRNLAQAFEWYSAAAKQGYALAQNDVGVFHMAGFGVARNQAEAVKWFSVAAAQGNRFGQCNLGRAYAEGRGVARDPKKAFQYCLLSARQGYPEAQWRVGMMVYQGLGVPENKEDAYGWLFLASRDGHTAAKQLMLRVKMDLNPKQIARAEAKARGTPIAATRDKPPDKPLPEDPPPVAPTPPDPDVDKGPSGDKPPVPPPSDPVRRVEPRPWVLTADQKIVLRTYGGPDLFTVCYEPSPRGGLRRVEVWKYAARGLAFSFVQGKLGTYDRWSPTPKAAGYPSLRPEDFYPGVTLQQVEKRVGTKPLLGNAVDPGVLPDAHIATYPGGLTVGFNGGALVYASTFALSR